MFPHIPSIIVACSYIKNDLPQMLRSIPFIKTKAKRPAIPHNGFWNLFPFSFFIVCFIFNCLCYLSFPLKSKC